MLHFDVIPTLLVMLAALPAAIAVAGFYAAITGVVTGPWRPLERRPDGILPMALAMGITFYVVQLSLLSMLPVAVNLLRLPVLLALSFGLLVLGVFLLRAAAPACQALGSRLRRNLIDFAPNDWLLVGLMIATFALMMARIILIIPGDHDTVSYHLSEVASWFPDGSLDRADRRVLWHYYPFLWHASYASLMLPARETTFALVPNGLATMALVLAIMGLARRLGASVTASLAAGAALALFPRVMVLSGTAQIETPIALLCVLLLALTLDVTEEPAPHWFHVALYGVFMAFLVGVKASGIPLAAFLLLVFAGLAAARSRRQPDYLARLYLHGLNMPVTVMAITLVLVLGGFWYYRNLILYANPLGVQEMSIGPLKFEGWHSKENLTRCSFAATFEWTNVAMIREFGVQLVKQFALFLPLLPVLALLGLIPWRRPRLPWAYVWAIVPFCLWAVFLWYVNPVSGNAYGQGFDAGLAADAIRFALPALALFYALVALGLDRLALPSLWLVGVLSVQYGLAHFFTFSRVYNVPLADLVRVEMSNPMRIVLALEVIALVTLPVLTVLVGQWWRRRTLSPEAEIARGVALARGEEPRWALTTAAISAAFIVLSPVLSAPLHQLREAQRPDYFFGVQLKLDELAQPGELILYHHSLWELIFYGRRLQYDAMYVDKQVNGDIEVLKSLMRRLGSRFIGIGPVNPRWNMALVDAIQHDPSFFPIHGGGDPMSEIVIYEWLEARESFPHEDLGVDDGPSPADTATTSTEAAPE